MLKRIIRTGEIKVWNSYKKQKRTNSELSYLFWECTLRCNFFCRHCGSDARAGGYEGELNTAEAKEAFRQIANNFDASH